MQLVIPLLMSAALVSGCVTTGPAATNLTGCEWVEPVYVTEDSVEAMSDATAQAIDEHNRAWLAACRPQGGVNEPG